MSSKSALFLAVFALSQCTALAGGDTAADSLSREWKLLTAQNELIKLNKPYLVLDAKSNAMTLKLGNAIVWTMQEDSNTAKLPVRDVIKAVLPEHELTQEAVAKRKRRKDRGQSEEGWFAVAKGMGLKFRLPRSGSGSEDTAAALPIRGIRNDVPVRFEEAGAVPKNEA